MNWLLRKKTLNGRIIGSLIRGLVIACPLSLYGQATGNLRAKPCDPQATKETVSLFNFLREVGRSGILFGQHHASVEGQHWKDTLLQETFKTDVEEVTGDDPAVFGFDFGKGISIFKNQVKAVYKKGGVITYSWHCPNPVTNADTHDKTGNPVVAILPGGSRHKEWLKKLDEIAAYFNSLEVDGVKVPVIFRPFHENTGGWFWWGTDNSTPGQFIALWRMTVDYLRKEKGVHNLLLAYSPDRPSEKKSLTEAMYPGDEYVDIIGVDVYAPDNEMLKKLIIDGSLWATELSAKRGKIAALTEVGIRKGLKNSVGNDWFMSGFLNLFKNDPSIHLAYMLTWRNNDPDHYWVPLAGQPNYNSFIQFYKDPYTLFLKDIKDVYSK